MRALVVFHDHGAHWASPALKRGFRHVFCAVESGDYWILFDPRDGRPVIEVVAPEGYDLATFYRAEGYSVKEIGIEAATSPIRWPYFWANCVGAVKAVIGLRAPLVVTPHQLYRRL
ncbi:hypothetical protein HBA54_27185 [Pelagibius litoralis]|uniref:Uncharacterized protein n=1 Tax=Pelagibius litoralis TaxID=374515 RepID=A0A967KDJ2_9PROT|nr:hypothetical protein [Pelagibius litoralis]NIA72282.1 hypothetical protein [Pelagibius litoralis]